MKNICKLSAMGAAAALSMTAVAIPLTVASAKQTSNTVLQMAPGVTGNFTDNFNPFSSNSTPGTNGFIYEPLFYFNTVGKQKYGLLAKSYYWSKDYRTLTVNLRKNVKWTDGKPFTAQDVLFTYKLIHKYPAADFVGVWSQIDSVWATGKYQVTFHFKYANVPYAWYLLSVDIVPEHIWFSLGDPTKVTITKPVGTGPYTVASFSPQAITFKANSNYYLGKPPVGTIQMNAFTDNNGETLALAKDQLDWGGIFIPQINKVYANNPKHKYWFPPSNITMLYTNLKDPLLKELPVRQAISLAINRDQLVKQAENGYVQPASPSGLVLPNDKEWLDPSLASRGLTKFTYNPKKAIAILEKAGFKRNSQGIFESRSGKPLAFTLKVVPGWSDWNMAANLIAEQLKKVGIQVTVQGEQVSAYMADLNNRNFQLAISWTNAGPGPFYLLDNFLDSWSGWNLEQWKDTKTDQYVNDYSSTTNPEKQKQDIYALENIVATKLPSIPLFYAVHWAEYSTAHFTGWPTPKNPYAIPDPYEWPAPAIVVMHLKPVQ